MFILILALLCNFAFAHMPVFDDDLRNKNVKDKSWALYEKIKQGDEIVLGLNIKTGNNISFSVNMAASQPFEVDVDYVNVSITGHNASQIKCDPQFNGWRVLSGTHGSDVVDQTQVITTTKVLEPLYFEPFGVGYYRKLAACQGPVPVGDMFNVSIKALKDIDLNVGVGMAESFSFVDIISMSVWITQTWFWDNYMVWWILITLGTISSLVYYNRDNLTLIYRSRTGLKLYNNQDLENTFVRSVLIFNSVHFLLRLIIINLNGYEKDVGAVVLATLVIHICLPLFVAWVWPNVTHNLVAYGLLLVYSSSLLWQGFFVLPIYCLWQFLWGLKTV